MPALESNLGARLSTVSGGVTGTLTTTEQQHPVRPAAIVLRSTSKPRPDLRLLVIPPPAPQGQKYHYYTCCHYIRADNRFLCNVIKVILCRLARQRLGCYG